MRAAGVGAEHWTGSRKDEGRSRYLAIREAKRLAALYPGDAFYVVQSIARIRERRQGPGNTKPDTGPGSAEA